MENAQGPRRIAAMADIHFTEKSESLHPVLMAASAQAEVLVICGDLTDLGHIEEARALAAELKVVRIPMVGVLGNHDFETGQQDEVARILGDAGLVLLDGTACEIVGIGFAGVKGFAGGFGRRALAPWGELAIKSFVQEALDETLKLGSALARLRTQHRVALLHYAPVSSTIEGEPLEIYPFLGSSHLEEPINRYEVDVVFHGHAHRGSLEGRTQANIPVYNVSYPLLKRAFPEKPAFRLFEFTSRQPDEAAAGNTLPAVRPS